jgi:hypothetical protein
MASSQMCPIFCHHLWDLQFLKSRGEDLTAGRLLTATGCPGWVIPGDSRGTYVPLLDFSSLSHLPFPVTTEKPSPSVGALGGGA